MTSQEYIQEFIHALELQLEKQKKEPKRIPLLEVKPVKVNSAEEIRSSRLYSLRLESTVPLEDVELELLIGDSRIPCELVSFFSSYQITVAVQKQLSLIPGRMFLGYRNTQLLEALIKRCRSITDYHRFALPERIFNRKPVVNRSRVQSLPAHLNPHQAAAAEASFGGDCLIWGPPGTGKTQTIAAAIDLHLQAGNHSLLLSHANTAVDGAFLRLAKTLKNTETYREGKMIRLGVCDEALVKAYPRVSLEHVIQLKSKVIREQIQALGQVLTEVQVEQEGLNQAAALKITAKEALASKDSAGKEGKQCKKQCTNLFVEIDRSKNRLLQKKQELERTNQSLLKRIWGKSPEDLNQEVIQEERNLHNLQQELVKAEKEEKHSGEMERHFAAQYQEKKQEYTRILSQFGVLEEGLEKHLQSADQKIRELEEDIARLGEKMDQLEKEILRNAVIVGATLTKVYLSDTLWNKSFDCVFVDEASMAPLPQLFLALSLASKQCTLIGDFLQLPPIEANISKDQDKKGLGAKWLDRSIFQVTDLHTVNACIQEPYVAPLKTQYRMNPAIADIVNQLFYGRILEHGERTRENVYLDSWSKEAPLVLLDTAQAQPRAINSRGKGTINLYHAIVAAHLVLSYLEENPRVTVGVATQYRRQAALIKEIVRDKGKRQKLDLDRVKINTIHSFQGGECDIIIYDSVESYGSARNPWLLLESNPHIELLLNVAVTRAQSKFILLANKSYVHKTFGSEEPFRKVVDLVEAKGCTVPSLRIDPYYRDTDDQRLEVMVNSGAINHYNEDTFWGCFLADLEFAQKRIVIFCPFLSEKRIHTLKGFLLKAIYRNVQVTLITKMLEEHYPSYQSKARDLLVGLAQYPVAVKLKKWMHHKIVLIDDHIVWEGSLNVLSATRTGEQMARVENKEVVKNLEACLQVNELLQLPDAKFGTT